MTLALNDEQRAAVEALAGPVIVTAGAGSGKTRTLCERFVRATTEVGDEVWTPAGVDEVLAITYTDRAAGEMAERIRATYRLERRKDDALAVDGAWISTIHGLCSRLLRRHSLEAGVDPNFTIADDVSIEELSRKAFEAVADAEMRSEEGRVLFEEYGFDAIYRAVTAAASHAVVLKEGTRALADPGVVSGVDDLLRGARDLFASAAGDVAACGSPTDTARQLETRCARVYEALCDLADLQVPTVDVVRTLLDVLAEWKPGRRVKAIEAVQGRLQAEHHDLCLEALDVRDRLLQRPLIRMAVAFREEAERLKRAQGLMDFHDLQTSVADLLERRPDVMERIRSGFRMTMVDEFQDTDALQLAIIERLAWPNLCTVGDGRQSIYGFRGADVKVYRSHLSKMRSQGAQDFSLATNYRSHPEVLKAVNAIFADEGLFGASSSPLRPGREVDSDTVLSGNRVRIGIVGTARGRSGESREREAAWVAARLHELAREYPLGAMVVLVRRYTHAETYARALRDVGLEAAVVGGDRLLTLPETDMVRALVRVIGNPHDEEALLHLLAGDVGRFSDDALALLAHSRSAGELGGIWEALQEDRCALNRTDEARRRAFVHAMTEARRGLGRRPLADLVLRVLERLDVDLLLLSRGTEGRQAFGNVLQLLRRIAQLESEGTVGPAAVESHFAAMKAYGADAKPAILASDGQETVRVMSVHASKGLEFPVVAAVELDSYALESSMVIRVGPISDSDDTIGFALRPPEAHSDRADGTRFGTMRAHAKRREAEEAARLFYVACTRAEEALVLSGAADLTQPPRLEDPQPISALRRVLFGTDATVSTNGVVELPLGGSRVAVEVLAETPPEGEGHEKQDVVPVVEHDLGHEEYTRIHSRSLSGGLGALESRLSRFSYSDLALYERCALRFHAQRILRMDVVRRNPKGASPADLGSAVHDALQLAGSRGLEPHRVEALARAYGLDAAGREALAQAVTGFMRSNQAARLSAHRVVRREWPFAVRMGEAESEFDLVGSLDAFGRTGDVGLIIDYKTGAQAADDDKRGLYALQAACYALAAHQDGCSEIRVEFVCLQAPDDSGEPSSVVFEFAQEELEEARKDIIGRVQRIRQSDPSPLDRWDDRSCGECPIAKTMCPVALPARR